MLERRKKLWLGTRRALTFSAVLVAVGIASLLLNHSRSVNAVAAILVVAAWLLPVLLVVRRSSQPHVASRTDVRTAQGSITRTVVNAIEDTRAKQSRHEYHQERSLERIERELRRLSVVTAPEPLALRGAGVDVLFVTSNGAGLGHISRLLAIAGHLSSARTVEFLTMSTAYRQVAQPGVTVHYFPSSESANESPETWNPIFRGYFRGLVERVRPRVVVFDGTWVYTGISDVCRTFGIPLVWVQRGLWKPEVDAASVQRHDARSVADEVIIPGDYAGAESVDAGEGIEPHYVGPIVMTRLESVFSREDACAHLGLDPSRRYVLLNLGGGAISDPHSIGHSALHLVRQHLPEMTPVEVVSPLAGAMAEVPGLRRIVAYPVMTYARAFDAMIAAAGYNSAQEAVALGIPSVLIPNTKTRTDDQARRARELAARGLCLEAGDMEQLREAVQAVSDAGVRQALRDRLATLEPPQGALHAAEVLEKICERAEWQYRVDALAGTWGHLE